MPDSLLRYTMSHILEPIYIKDIHTAYTYSLQEKVHVIFSATVGHEHTDKHTLQALLSGTLLPNSAIN